jgi:mRNA interferase MazF
LEDGASVGKEIKKHRPHVVLSNQGHNDTTSLVVCVPVTTNGDPYSFKEPITGLNKPSWAVTNQVLTADWRAREAFSIGFVTATEIAKIRGKMKALLGII